MQCAYLKTNGEKCKANAMKESEFCFTHNPATREQHAAAVVMGGLHSSRKDKIDLPAINIQGPEGVAQLLEQTINGVRDGSIPANLANTIGYLAGCMLKAIEASDLDKRLEIIERVVLERKMIARNQK